MKRTLTVPPNQPCEVAAKEVMPSIRASIAYVLVNEFKLSKYEAAKLLGLTPAAVSNYIDGRRGEKYVMKILNDKANSEKVRHAALLILTQPQDPIVAERFQDITCSICSSVNEVAQNYGCHYLLAIRRASGATQVARNNNPKA